MLLLAIVKGVTVFVSFVCIICHTASLVYTDKDGVTVRYKVTMGTFCGNEAESFNKFVGIPISECVKECGIRQGCKGLRYHRRYTLCELLSDPNDEPQTERSCIFIPASDIVVEPNPCPNCGEGQTCDTETKSCETKECKDVDTDTWLRGNMRNVGDKIMQRCDGGYNYSVCLEDGTWNKSDVCKPLRNVALNKKAFMSSDYGTFSSPSRGVDGDMTTYFHTIQELNPWWHVDLGLVFNIVEVKVFNRITYVYERAKNFSLQLGITIDSLKEYERVEQLDKRTTFKLPANTFARYVRTQIFTYNFLHLEEVEVMAPPQ